jgi:hypothetical protein
MITLKSWHTPLNTFDALGDTLRQSLLLKNWYTVKVAP